MSVHFSFKPDDGSNKSADVKCISWFSLFGGRLFFIGFVVVLFVAFFVFNFRRENAFAVGATVASPTATLYPTFTPTLVPSATPTLTPLPTATLVPSATPTLTPSPTATLIPSATPTITPSPTLTPLPTATSTPFFIVNLLPANFSPGWCVQVRADAVWTMAGDRFASGKDGYVYFSSEVLSQRVIIERGLWYHDYYFNDCGRYE